MERDVQSLFLKIILWTSKVRKKGSCFNPFSELTSTQKWIKNINLLSMLFCLFSSKVYLKDMSANNASLTDHCFYTTCGVGCV